MRNKSLLTYYIYYFVKKYICLVNRYHYYDHLEGMHPYKKLNKTKLQSLNVLMEVNIVIFIKNAFVIWNLFLCDLIYIKDINIYKRFKPYLSKEKSKIIKKLTNFE